MIQNFTTDENIIENLDCAVLLLDSQKVIRRVNISAETLFEQSRRNLVGKAFTEVLSIDSLEKFIADCIESSSQLTLRELKIELPHKSIIADMTISAIAENREVSGVLIEIGLINRLSKLIREQNQRERQQSFRLMIRGLGHEIKNPLGGIRGAAQLLERELRDPGQKELTNILIKEADRLTRLVDRVMGSREQLKLNDTNIHEVLEHVIELVSFRSKTPLVIHRDYDPTLPEVEIDKEQMIQALLNIIINAVEAQPNSKKPEFGVVTQFVRGITINRKPVKRALMIQIWDSGPGVPEAFKENLFDPLITGRPEGSGLGLSITQEIFQRHEGSVQLQEYQGKTCFTVYLPYGRNK